MSRDGGPAFPALDFVVPSDLEAQHVHRLGSVRGMTLRDYFAAHALTQLMPTTALHDAYTAAEIELVFVNAAAFAYRCADAMLAEREKEQK